MSCGRVSLAAGFVLHRRPYRETSLLLEVFAADWGRLPLVARGARRGRGGMQALLEPFRPLLLSWGGGGEVASLAAAEADGPAPPLAGAALASGFYLNELLMRLTARHDPHPHLYRRYRDTLGCLAADAADVWALRLFERDLLAALGYGLSLAADAGGAPLRTEATYCYLPEQGPVAGAGPCPPAAVAVSGATLLALAGGAVPDAAGLGEAKRLMRAALRPYLGDKPLASRALFARAGGRC